MFCINCGAAVSGHYCSCCGRKVRPALAEFRLAERRRRKSFDTECQASFETDEKAPDNEKQAIVISRSKLADACWMRAEALNPDPTFWPGPFGSKPCELKQNAYEILGKVEADARAMFNQVLPVFSASSKEVRKQNEREE